MAFTPTNEVERLLIAAVSDEQSRPAFYRALLEHDLFVITDGQAPHAGVGEPPRKLVTQHDTSVNVCMVEYEGALHAPIFSSAERIAAAISEPVRSIGMNGRAMFTMLRGSKILMNLGSDCGKVFLPHEVEAMLNGTIMESHPHTRLDVGGKEILFAQPKVYPQRLVEALRERFTAMREVKAAYLAHVFIAEIDASPHTLIGIEADGNWDHIVAEAGGVVRAVAEPGQCVDFVQIGRETDQSIRQYMQRDTKPFYRRKRFLGLF
jgi:hypothetical protein